MIVAAAISHSGWIYIGARHPLIRESRKDTLGDITKGKEGFVDEFNKFYTRPEAAEHALKCGQILFKQDTLWSEDLW